MIGPWLILRGASILSMSEVIYFGMLDTKAYEGSCRRTEDIERIANATEWTVDQVL